MVDKNILKNIKLVVLDLDGTLLNDRGEIGSESLKLIARLKQEGVKFTIASGRLHSSIMDYAKQMNLDIPLISLDGSLIKSNSTGKIFFESFIPQKKAIKALNYANRYLSLVAFCHENAIYYTEHNENIFSIIEKYGAAFVQVEDYIPYSKKCLEIVLASDSLENLSEINERLNFPYTFGLYTNLFKSHSSPGVYCLEIRKAGSSKAKALFRLIRKIGVKISETAVIGDWYNDKPLFETKALKVAPANAVAEIRYAAQIKTMRTNNEDAVAEFLQMLISARNGS